MMSSWETITLHFNEENFTVQEWADIKAQLDETAQIWVDYLIETFPATAAGLKEEDHVINWFDQFSLNSQVKWSLSIEILHH